MDATSCEDCTAGTLAYVTSATRESTKTPLAATHAHRVSLGDL
jgi:hypothetical protein